MRLNKMKSRASRWILGIAVVVSAAVWAKTAIFKPTTPISSRVVDRALHELAYVGNGRCTTVSSVPHGWRKLTLPASLSASDCYVFHVPFRTNADLHTYLEEHLEEGGATVTSAPRSPADMTYLMTGGPLFSISFRHGSHVAKLSTVQHAGARDGDTRGEWKREDVVVRYEH